MKRSPLVLLVLTALASAEATYQPMKYVICKNQKNVRTIRIVSKGSDANSNTLCETKYTKAGVDQTVGAGRVAACESVLAKVRTNLENASWVCKEVSSVEVLQGQSSQ